MWRFTAFVALVLPRSHRSATSMPGSRAVTTVMPGHGSKEDQAMQSMARRQTAIRVCGVWFNLKLREDWKVE